VTRLATGSSRGIHRCLRGTAALSVTACFALAYLAPGGASAASTRAEYVAQVDSICRAFRGPASTADSAYIKNAKRWERLARKGTVKAFVSQNGRLARSLLRFTHIHMGVTDQIATVPPPEADAATVSTWLTFRRQSDAFATSAASALKHFKFERFFKQNRRSGNTEAAGRETVSSFGFQVCAVPGVYL
jgi:hypothetical protein